MTYGYDSHLVGQRKAENRLLDHQRLLIQAIENARSLVEVGVLVSRQVVTCADSVYKESPTYHIHWTQSRWYLNFAGRVIMPREIYKTLTKYFQALIESRRNPAHKHILDATYSIMFFGTPHLGMRTYDLEEMINAETGGNETSRHNLLRQLREGSGFLEKQKEELSYIWKELKIVSFYETTPTPTVERVGLCLA